MNYDARSKSPIATVFARNTANCVEYQKPNMDRNKAERPTAQHFCNRATNSMIKGEAIMEKSDIDVGQLSNRLQQDYNERNYAEWS